MTALIDRFVGMDPGSPMDISFAARMQADLSHQLLLHPVDAGAVSLLERHAFVALWRCWMISQKPAKIVVRC